MLHSNTSEDRHQQGRNPPAIIIIERQILTRTCILKVLKGELPHWDIIEMASTSDLNLAIGKNVHLIAFDIESRTVSDPEVEKDLAILRDCFPDTPIAVLSAKDDDATILGALQSGVSGFFSTSIPVDVALAGLRLVLAGGVYCPRPIGMVRTGGLNAGTTPPCSVTRSTHPTAPQPCRDGDDDLDYRTDASEDLTPRERDVLAELQLGRTNKIIAAKLNLSENTVKMHIQHLMRKLQARNRTEAVVQWHRRQSDGIAAQSATQPYAGSAVVRLRVETADGSQSSRNDRLKLSSSGWSA
jgi:DNA-binding NarL/FixJ family response regulator